MNKSKQNTPAIDLNKEFKQALELMENSGKSVFITGRAGTGKSTLLTYFCRTTGKKVVVLAPTGVAALNVKGQTIHSFFKFRPNITQERVENYAPVMKERIFIRNWMPLLSMRFLWSEPTCWTASINFCG